MRILYLQYTNPGGYPPLEHSSRILAEQGWEVLFLGIALQSELRFPPHPRINVKLLSAVSAGWQQKLHYFGYCLWVIGWVIRWNPKWIYASDPLSTPVSWLLTYFPNLKVLYHEHDSPDESATSSRFMDFVISRRQSLSRRTTANILPNEIRANWFRTHTKTERPVLTVWNCPRLDEVTRQSIEPPSRYLKLLYHGAIVKGRPSFSLLEALTLLPEEVELHIIGYEVSLTSQVIPQWLKLAEEKGVSQRLFIHPPMPRQELLQHVPKYDIGIAFMPKLNESINYLGMVGASNKAFDYMAGGLGLLVNNELQWKTMYADQGFGMACDPDSPIEIATKIMWLLQNPVERKNISMRVRQQILNKWHYELQFAPVLQVLNSDNLPNGLR